jgi:hypothetical protein
LVRAIESINLVGQDLQRPAPQEKNVSIDWSLTKDDEFILEEKSLYMVFKDGHTFIRKRRDVLMRRLLSTDSVATSLLIVHPDFDFIDGVSSMDPDKRHSRATDITDSPQRKDALSTFFLVQQMRQEILDKYRIDIAERMNFIGYPCIPTWTGFVGSSAAFIQLYSTHPTKGVLLTMHPKAALSNKITKTVYAHYENDVRQIIRLAQNSSPKSQNLWRYPKNRLPSRVAP